MLPTYLALHLSTKRSRGRLRFSAHSMIGQPIGGAGQGDNRQVRAPWKLAPTLYPSSNLKTLKLKLAPTLYPQIKIKFDGNRLKWQQPVFYHRS